MAENVVLFSGNATSRPVVIKISGHTPEDVAASIKLIGALPPSAVSDSQKKTAKYVARMASALAPTDTGALASGIIVGKKEKSRKQGKAVYGVFMDPAKNAKFQKPYGREGKYAYYPASMEYGFRRGSTKVFHGLYYMKSAAIAVEPYHEQITWDYLVRRLDTIWAKKSGGST